MLNMLWLDGVDPYQMVKGEQTIDCLCKSNGIIEACPKCGVVEAPYKHGVKQISFRDSLGVVFGKPIDVLVDVQRFKCRSCGATYNQPVPGMDEKHLMTKRCVGWIVERGIIDTFSAVARDVGVSEKTVRDICMPEFKARLAKLEIGDMLEAPIVLGLDELKLDGKMRAIFTDIGRRRVLDLIPSNDKGDIEHWFLTKIKNPPLIKVVCIDMCNTYRSLVYKLFPDAIVVADKYHVVRGATKALDKVRNRARRAATDPKDKKNPWRGQRLLRTHAYKLNDEAAAEVAAIKGRNPIVNDAHIAKEAFYAIWNTDSREEAERRFKEWSESIPAGVKKEFGALAGQIKRWHKEVFNYFDCGFTNALTENRNGEIKLVNRKGKGYDFDVLRAKVLLAPPLTGKVCKCCKKNAATASFSPVTLGGWEPGDEEFEAELCGSCRYLWDTIYMPIKKSLIEGWARDG